MPKNIIARGRKTKHGESSTPEYKSWQHMKDRCYNPKNKDWALYGGRGITVWDRWRTNFLSFLHHIGPKPEEGYSIDRFPNPDGNYEPGNVRWANQGEQMRNYKRNIYVIYKGERRLMVEVCRELGINYGTVKTRRMSGCPDEDLFKRERRANVTRVLR